MALTREVVDALRVEYTCAIVWKHAWSLRRDERGPHPGIQMDPAERERRERRYDRIQGHWNRAWIRYCTVPRVPMAVW